MQTKRPKLLLASHNQGKIREYKGLLRGIPFEIVTPADLGIIVSVEEVGGSFEENSTLKAAAITRQSGLLSLADDSGLEVDALRGEPGARSHRYAGEGASDIDRNKYLLAKLKSVPEKERTARFRCVIAIALPSGKFELFSGECPGVIIDEPKGTQGFGYDPIFYLPELGKTMAELTLEEKNNISHRAKAAEKAREYLIDITDKLGA
jgi:XTP/dITP diphosphohydrolase